MNRLEEYLWYVDFALDQMTAILVGLGDELASTRPDLPGANSPYAIVTHCCGVMEWWGGEMVAGRRVERDRAAEFVATGAVSDLLELVEAAKSRLRADVAGLDWAAPPRGVVDPADADLPLGQTKSGVLLHIYEELSQHLGQLELTRDVLRANASG
ncbi:MAG: DinB family protein [Actinomycetota bacterium]|nr:DinB family protein [Actinomycetota bacterium]